MKEKPAPKKPKPAKPTAAGALTQAKQGLEQAILRACNAFERETGLCVYTVRHPRDRDRGDALPCSPLAKDDRVEVGVVPPFQPPFPRYR